MHPFLKERRRGKKGERREELLIVDLGGEAC